MLLSNVSERRSNLVQLCPFIKVLINIYSFKFLNTHTQDFLRVPFIMSYTYLLAS